MNYAASINLSTRFLINSMMYGSIKEVELLLNIIVFLILFIISCILFYVLLLYILVYYM